MLFNTITVTVLLSLAYCHSHHVDASTTEEDHINRLIANATKMKYAIERQGFVAERSVTCGTVIFDFNRWLTGAIFAEASEKLERNQTYHDSADLIRSIGTDLIRSMREHFIHETVHLPKSSVASSMESLKSVSTIEINQMNKYESNPSYEDNIEKEIMFQKRKQMLSDMAHEHLGEFKLIFNAFKLGTVSNWIMEWFGGEQTYVEIISKILDQKYNGSLAQELKGRLASVITFEPVMSVGFHSLAVKTCIPDMSLETMLPLFEIRPIGVIEGDIYSERLLPKYYALPDEFQTIDDLFVADSFVYQQHGFSIVSSFKAQGDKPCKLGSPLKCMSRRYNLTKEGGTMVFRMTTIAIVATKLDYADCTGWKRQVKLESHVFVHNHTKCRLEVGDEVVGDKVVEIELEPSEFIIFAFNDEPTEHHQHNTDMGILFNFTIGVEIGVIVFVAAIIIFAFVLYFCVYKKIINKKKRKEREADAMRAKLYE